VTSCAAPSGFFRCKGYDQLLAISTQTREACISADEHDREQRSRIVTKRRKFGILKIGTRRKDNMLNEFPAVEPTVGVVAAG